MKSKISHNSCEEKSEFPVLMQDVDSDLVVMFINESSGVVVNTNKLGANELGEYDESWENCTDRTEWKKFKGEITLSND